MKIGQQQMGELAPKIMQASKKLAKELQTK